MNIKYNTQKIKKIITDLSVLTGISIDLIDTDYKIIASCKKENNFCSFLQSSSGYGGECHHSDRDILEKCKDSGKPESHICHAGLCDFAMPLIKRDITVGYIIMGQIRSPLSPESFEGDGVLNRLYSEIPLFTDEKIESLKNLLPLILFENAIEIEFDSFITEVTEFIDDNLRQDLSITALCRRFNVSKNYLYKSFHGYFGSTVNDYVSSARIKKAQSLLKETIEPVYKIAYLVGIDNYTYFCKLFKSKTGVTPSEYRIKHC